MSKIWDALKKAELGREPSGAPALPPSAENLSPEQQDAVRALLVHGSVGAAAQACGVASSALERWLRMPDFVAAYHAASLAARARR